MIWNVAKSYIILLLCLACHSIPVAQNAAYQWPQTPKAFRIINQITEPQIFGGRGRKVIWNRHFKQAFQVNFCIHKSVNYYCDDRYVYSGLDTQTHKKFGFIHCICMRKINENLGQGNWNFIFILKEILSITKHLLFFWRTGKENMASTDGVSIGEGWDQLSLKNTFSSWL